MDEEVCRHGLIRNVFPQNFLTAVHLEKRIDGTRLSAWIARRCLPGDALPNQR